MPNKITKIKWEKYYRRIGWVGFTSGRPDFENVIDDYTNLGEDGAPAVNVYKNKKEAKKRYEDVREVFVRI